MCIFAYTFVTESIDNYKAFLEHPRTLGLGDMLIGQSQRRPFQEVLVTRRSRISSFLFSLHWSGGGNQSS